MENCCSKRFEFNAVMVSIDIAFIVVMTFEYFHNVSLFNYSALRVVGRVLTRKETMLLSCEIFQNCCIILV